MVVKVDYIGVIKNPNDDAVVKGTAEALKVLKDKGWTISVTAKDKDDAEKFLKDNDIPFDSVNSEEEADLIISAKAMCFSGHWDYMMSSIAEHETWYERSKREEDKTNLEADYTRGEAWAAERDGDYEKAKKLRKVADNMFGLDAEESKDIKISISN